MLFRRPKIKDSFSVLINKAGDISVGKRAGASFVVCNPPLWVSDCLALLNGIHEVGQIYELLNNKYPTLDKKKVDKLLTSLTSISAIEDQAYVSEYLNDTELDLYSRQMQGFSLIEKHGRNAIYYQEILKKQNVLVFGAGGWGSWLTMNLALSGFGNITLVDGDNVELSNLNRQILYTHEDIGKLKVLAAKENLNNINPHICVQSVPKYLLSEALDLLNLLIRGKTLIFLAWTNLAYYIDSVATESIHRVAHEMNIPVFEIGANPFEVSVGPIFANDRKSPCFQCVKSEIKDSFFSKDEKIRSFQKLHLEKMQHNQNQPPSAQNATSLSIMGGIAVDQAIKFVTNMDRTVTYSTKFQMFLNDLSIKNTTYNKKHNCICSNKI